ncbi:putative Rho-GTPase-activating protein 7 [Neolecta irregularis DAH-3]|uniref:Putative Rho-GTPase-activating protein 7 n=1 Tax=Neolecta irregularis (strain DAH-3) TaxID=1198029 RepID=A0A1U7LIJ8_NEOID|nr:putative Rho-GTPase-activating protein 7 [Neolecta irregularis DAH-3]|eukprot:OLL22486.1 putative Rho-GTPase-activating protein 7 [Neolecta irregularis DAH-3]
MRTTLQVYLANSALLTLDCGLKECLNLIHNEDDFRDFVLGFAAKMPKEKPREEIAYEANAAINPYFGVSLDVVIARDGAPIPSILTKCANTVEQYGMNIEGIYRLSRSASSMNKLKQAFDLDPRNVILSSYTSVEDVNCVASLLKQFFRELPDPLLTKTLYRDFIDAAKLSDDIRRRDSIHSLINRLDDNNYTTLRALVFHLDRIAKHEQTNRMPISNLAIVWAPNLMNSEDFSAAVGDSAWQNRVIETIIVNCRGIFDEE